MHLDKDILIKGNKKYSKKTCIFVPNEINGLFIRRNSSRGNLPIGVGLNKSNNKYIARCSINGKTKHIGIYDTPEEAFYSYKEYKEDIIKNIADKYREQIPKELYMALINYEIDIND